MKEGTIVNGMIKEFMKDHELSLRKMASMMNMPFTTLNHCLKNNRPIDSVHVLPIKDMIKKYGERCFDDKGKVGNVNNVGNVGNVDDLVYGFYGDQI